MDKLQFLVLILIRSTFRCATVYLCVDSPVAVVDSGVRRRDPARPRHPVESQLPGVLQAEQGVRLEDHRTDRLHGGTQVPVLRGTSQPADTRIHGVK